MELIVISETKLKIMLTAPDMVRYELEGSPMDCADARTRAAFRHIFDDARAEIGFDTEGERLFIQLYASKGGGCEIFVTKLGGGSELWDDEIPLPEEPRLLPTTAVSVGGLSDAERELLEHIYADREEGGSMPRTELTTLPMMRTAVLRFACLRDLLAVCRRLPAAEYRGNSSAYIENGGQGERWYLCLEVEDCFAARFPPRLVFLSEYGEEADGEYTEVYLREYGRCICEGNAVETLGVL